MKNSKKIEYINEHREAVGRSKLAKTMNEENVKKHLRLIDLNAPFGMDPWAEGSLK